MASDIISYRNRPEKLFVATGGLDNQVSIKCLDMEIDRDRVKIGSVLDSTCVNHRGYISSLDFHSRYHRILTASGDGTLSVSDFSYGDGRKVFNGACQSDVMRYVMLLPFACQ